MLLDNALQFLYRHGMVPGLFGINQCGRAALAHPQAVSFGAVDATAGMAVAQLAETFLQEFLKNSKQP